MQNSAKTAQTALELLGSKGDAERESQQSKVKALEESLAGERAAVEKLQQELDVANVAAERAAEQHTENLAALEAQRCVLVRSGVFLFLFLRVRLLDPLIASPPRLLMNSTEHQQLMEEQGNELSRLQEEAKRRKQQLDNMVIEKDQLAAGHVEVRLGEARVSDTVGTGKGAALTVS